MIIGRFIIKNCNGRVLKLSNSTRFPNSYIYTMSFSKCSTKFKLLKIFIMY